MTADDFFFTGLRNPGNTNNPAGSVVTAANVEKFPGVNTLGVSIARIDYAPGGQNPPHTRPVSKHVRAVRPHRAPEFEGPQNIIYTLDIVM